MVTLKDYAPKPLVKADSPVAGANHWAPPSPNIDVDVGKLPDPRLPWGPSSWRSLSGPSYAALSRGTKGPADRNYLTLTEPHLVL